jgi:hypothetical protein
VHLGDQRLQELFRRLRSHLPHVVTDFAGRPVELLLFCSRG